MKRPITKRQYEADRLNTVAACLAYVIKDDFVRFARYKLTESKTTSNAPLIRLEAPDGAVFNITITKARK